MSAHHIHDRTSTEAMFFDAYDQMKSDLAEERQNNMLLTDQLRTERITNDGLSYKVDYLKSELERITASREHYEQISIRASAMLGGGLSMMIKLLEDLQEEIRIAGSAKVPVTVSAQPEGLEDGEKPLFLQDVDQEFQTVLEAQFHPMTKVHYTASSELPPNRFANGAVRA